MIKRTGIFATTMPDVHGDTFSRRDLEKMAEQINSSYFPVNIEHDPRTPTVGRVLAARVITREDGVTMVEADMEIFEDGDVVPLGAESREMPLERQPPDAILVKYDRP